MSLAEPSIPAPAKIVTDSSVEMTWKVFGGEYNEIYLALLKARVSEDRFPPSDEILQQQFRLHLHRGIGYLAGKVADRQITNISDLFRITAEQRK
jgi:DNA sulfur modification protein DndE